jgi:SAM-dependent MidA family methyltransferase
VTPLTPAGELLAAEIDRSGPIPFSRFMEVALYHSEFGYYRTHEDPFGTAGDFFTAEQLQPVFGRLLAAYLRTLRAELALTSPMTVVELGAGRAEMRNAFSEFHYVPVDIGYGAMPERFTGVVFSNEFLDAVPVDVVVARAGAIVEMLVSFDSGRFRWVDGAEVVRPLAEALGNLEEGDVREVQTERLRWLDRIDASLESGFVVTIDYGFTRRELIRFPLGTLMSYRRHQALDDVLAEPGNRDITAHVPFTDLQVRGEMLGWSTVTFEPLARLLLRAGELDQFESALAGDSERDRLKHRMQLKTLLFGMGETFRVLVQRK